ERPRHFRRRDQRAFFFQSIDDAAVERPRPAAFTMQVDDSKSAQIGSRFGGGKLRREHQTEYRRGGGDSRNKRAAPLHAPNPFLKRRTTELTDATRDKI